MALDNTKKRLNSAHIKPERIKLRKNKNIILCVFSRILPKLYVRAEVKHRIYFMWPQSNLRDRSLCIISDSSLFLNDYAF